MSYTISLPEFTHTNPRRPKKQSARALVEGIDVASLQRLQYMRAVVFRAWRLQKMPMIGREDVRLHSAAMASFGIIRCLMEAAVIGIGNNIACRLLPHCMTSSASPGTTCRGLRAMLHSFAAANCCCWCVKLLIQRKLSQGL